MNMSKNPEESIREIQSWLKTQRFLPDELNKAFIRTFILGCDGDLNRTKTVIGNYFYARQSIPELFSKRDPLLQENIDSWKVSCFVPLKDQQDGCKVFLGTALDSENYNYVQFAKQVFMCFDLLIKNNEWGDGNRILVLNYEKIKDMTTFTIYITRKTAECERDSFLPGKLKAVHNVHIPPFMNKIHERIRTILTPNEEKTIMFHKTLRGLHKYINPKILPLEFGGKAGSLNNLKDTWYEILKENRSFFIEEEQKRMQEIPMTEVTSVLNEDRMIFKGRLIPEILLSFGNSKPLKSLK